MDNEYEFLKVFKSLKEMNLNVVSDQEIINVFCGIEEKLLVVGVISKGSCVFRTRVWDKVPSIIPISASEISYNSNPPDYYGRANFKGQSVFYGSMNSDNLNGYFNTNFEVLNFDYNKIDRKYFITSCWELQKDLNVVIIGNELLHGGVSAFDREIFIKNIEDIKPCFKSKALLFDQFISKEFSKIVKEDNNLEYKISAAFTNYIFSQGFPAVIYSSVASNGAGINIAFNTNVIDDKVLIPKRAVYGVFYNRFDETIQDYKMIGEIGNDWILSWKDCLDTIPNFILDFYTGKTDVNVLKDKVPFVDLNKPLSE